jgi:hypothetical protein
MNLRPVDRDHPDPDTTGLGAEHEYLTKQPGQRRLVALSKARNRRVVGPPDWRRSRAWPRPRCSAARSVARTVQRSRTRRATARPSSPDRAPRGHDRRPGKHVERPQIELRDGVDNKPRQMGTSLPTTPSCADDAVNPRRSARSATTSSSPTTTSSATKSRSESSDPTGSAGVTRPNIALADSNARRFDRSCPNAVANSGIHRPASMDRSSARVAVGRRSPLPRVSRRAAGGVSDLQSRASAVARGCHRLAVGCPAPSCGLRWRIAGWRRAPSATRSARAGTSNAFLARAGGRTPRTGCSSRALDPRRLGGHAGASTRAEIFRMAKSRAKSGEPRGVARRRM